MYKLLIADDETLEREAIKYILKEGFGEVFGFYEATNGRETIEQVNTVKPDIVFLDIKMPGINGLEAARQLRNTFPELRIVIVSAYQYFNYAQEALALGVDDFIAKPASAEKIINVIKKVVLAIETDHAKKRKAEETDEKLKQVTQCLQEELLQLIALGEIEEQSIVEYFHIFNAHYPSFIFAIIAISNYASANDGPEIEKSLQKKKAMAKIKVIVQSLGYDLLIGSVGQEIHLLLLLNEELDEYQSRIFGIQFFSKVKEQVLKEENLTLNIGIGNVCHGIAEIYQSHLQAKGSLRYDQTPGALVSFGDINTGYERKTYPVIKEKLLYERIVQGDVLGSTALLDELLDWIIINVPGLDDLKRKAFELLLVIIRETAISTNLLEIDLDTDDLRSEIFNLENNREIIGFVKKFVLTKMEEMSAAKISRAGLLLTMAVEYLENHYNKQELSLEEVALKVKLSPFYLSKLFKKETGENFIDYLTGLRIRKSKEFLANPLSSVKEVCYQVGYKDPNYFARVFKKISGVTPTEYKVNKPH